MQVRSTKARLAASLGAAAVLGLAGASGAQASSVQTVSNGAFLYYFGDAGGNTVNMAPASGGGVTITDSQPITVAPGSNCTGDGTNTVTCPGDTTSDPAPNPKFAGYYAFLGDGPNSWTNTAVLVQNRVSGGDGVDTINAGPGPQNVSGGGGNDTIAGGVVDDDLLGGDGNDTIDGAGGSDEVDGGNDDDTITGGAGDDDVYGGNGNDTVNGGAGSDYVEGDLGNDTVNGEDGDDTVTGDYDDPLDTGDVAGTDTLNGGNGDDYFPAGTQQDPGADAVNGGAGRDEVDYSDEQAGVIVSADGVVGDGLPGENDTVGSDVEDIDGTNYDDTLTGNNSANSLYGYSGNDTLNGQGGDDDMYGYDGTDVLNGGADRDYLDGNGGADTVNGEDGDDEISAGDGEADVLNGGNGSDTVDYFSGQATSVSLDGQANDGVAGEGDNAQVENVNTGGGNDTVTGSSDRNIIDTGGGDDAINVAGDSAVDDVTCGSGFDSATVDAGDAYATTGEDTKCENVNGGPAVTSPAANVNQVPQVDTTAPKIKATAKCQKKAAAFKKRGCTLTVSANETFRFGARMTASFKKATLSAAGSGLILAEKETGFSGTSNKLKVTLKPSKKLLAKTPKKFKVKIKVTAYDKGGNPKSTTKTVTVKR